MTKSPIPFFVDLLDWDFLEQLFDAAADIVYCVKDREGRYQSVNQAFVERVDASHRSELIGRTAEDFFPPALAKIYRQQDELVWNSGRPIVDQMEQITNPDGRLGWYLASKFPLVDPRTTRTVALVGISQDLHSPSDRDIEMANVKMVVDRIHEQLDQSLSVERLAEMTGLSVEQLDRRMKRVFRLSTKKYIMKTRLERAMELLTGSDESLAAIAAKCGFTDQSAMTRQFRSATNMTPAAYRRHHRGGR